MVLPSLYDRAIKQLRLFLIGQAGTVVPRLDGPRVSRVVRITVEHPFAADVLPRPSTEATTRPRLIQSGFT
jgi:hypothetical protein